MSTSAALPPSTSRQLTQLIESLYWRGDHVHAHAAIKILARIDPCAAEEVRDRLYCFEAGQPVEV